MRYLADFHIHSRFSRATAKNFYLEDLYITSQIKGITVVGTGDFTHPEWFSEISEKLVPAEEGLYCLKKNLRREFDKKVPTSCRSKVRFVLTTEISNIYKKGGKTRKNHNLIFVPDLKTALRFSERLAEIGNIYSDGRPILGLDAKDLLQILIDISETAFLIPAHIWTPWFSVLGSKSGFDSIEECFEELSEYVFAVETGLSSDPAMIRRVSDLDKFTLVSNSDAHSPSNIGREANIFDTDLTYPHMVSALKEGNKETFIGTYEFFSKKGKYYIDGHRSCNICFYPKESKRHKGICPKCGKPLTQGVLNRIEELADRNMDHFQIQKNELSFYSSIPLKEILAEIFTVGPKSKTVLSSYQKLLIEHGNEYYILHHLPIETLYSSGEVLLAEALSRMRSGNLNVDPGYDGEYGKTKIFHKSEREKLIKKNSYKRKR